jgi:DNA-binding response OmpR family regulator
MAGQSVLAIEHNWQIRKLLRANLEALGLEVREAVNQRHGLDSLERGRPDLILLDLDLPNNGAVKLLRDLDLRFQARPVPILLLSAEPPARSVLHGVQVAGWLLKPFDVANLIERIEGLLGPRTAQSSN